VFFGYVTYPIKFLDYFLARNKYAFMIACSVFFVGQKRGAGARGAAGDAVGNRRRTDAAHHAAPHTPESEGVVRSPADAIGVNGRDA
jgi:hypothetical protein